MDLLKKLEQSRQGAAVSTYFLWDEDFIISVIMLSRIFQSNNLLPLIEEAFPDKKNFNQQSIIFDVECKLLYDRWGYLIHIRDFSPLYSKMIKYE